MREPIRKRGPAGATPDPANLGEVLSQLFSLRGYGSSRRERQLQQMWSAVADEEWKSQTKVLGVKNGVLMIAVSNSSLLSELASFQKWELLERLQSSAHGKGIRDLKFKVRGDLDAQHR